MDTLKKCKDCKVEKPLSVFGDDWRNKDRHKGICKPCENMRLAKWRENNRDTKYKEHMEQSKERNKASYAKDKTPFLARCKTWRSANKEYKAACDKKWQQANKERVNAGAKRRNDLDRDAFNAKARARAHRYIESKRAATAYRRAKKLQATPVWVDRDGLKNIYIEAAQLSKQQGTDYHVDHIIPLVHPLVSGLHVPWNLQILPAKANQSKSNSFVCG